MLLESLSGRGVPVLIVGEKLLRRMVSRDGPDGIAATVALGHRTLNDVCPGAHAVVVVVTGIDLVGNLGSLIRCADATTVSAVVIADGRHERTHPLVVRSSMGTVFSGRPSRPAARRPSSGCDDTGSVSSPPIPVHDGRIGKPTTADGSPSSSAPNAPGLPGLWRVVADLLARIPMGGVADSLNVAVAGALILYEARHRKQHEPAEWLDSRRAKTGQSERAAHAAHRTQRVVVGTAATRSRSMAQPHAEQTTCPPSSSRRRVTTSASPSARAWRSRALACARSYAMVAPSGSCSSSVEVSSDPSTIAATMASRDAIWRAVRTCSAGTTARRAGCRAGAPRRWWPLPPDATTARA